MVCHLGYAWLGGVRGQCEDLADVGAIVLVLNTVMQIVSSEAADLIKDVLRVGDIIDFFDAPLADQKSIS